jgi:hypothetical protein
MSVFSKIGGGQVFGSSRPIAHGRHTFEVKSVLHHAGQGQKTTDWFIVEVITVDSVVHAPGEERSWVVDLGQASGPGNAKGFLFALGQCATPTLTDHDLSDAQWERYAELVITGAKTPARGVRMSVEVFATTTRAGKDFSKHVWSAVGGQDAARVSTSIAGGKAVAPPPASVPVPPAPPVAPAVELPAALVTAVGQWRTAGNTPEQIRAGLGAWASTTFGAGVLDAALRA